MKGFNHEAAGIGAFLGFMVFAVLTLVLVLLYTFYKDPITLLILIPVSFAGAGYGIGGYLKRKKDK